MTSEHTPRTYYEVLQVHPAAPLELITAAYWRLTGELQSRRTSDPEADAELFYLTQSYQALADSRQRAAYDLALGIQPGPLVPRRPRRLGRRLFARRNGHAVADNRVDHYDILRVSRMASPGVIQEAYSVLRSYYLRVVRLTDESPDILDRLDEAYAVTSDPERRRRYDESRAPGQETEPAPPVQAPEPPVAQPADAPVAKTWPVVSDGSAATIVAHIEETAEPETNAEPAAESSAAEVSPFAESLLVGAQAADADERVERQTNGEPVVAESPASSAEVLHSAGSALAGVDAADAGETAEAETIAEPVLSESPAASAELLPLAESTVWDAEPEATVEPAAARSSVAGAATSHLAENQVGVIETDPGHGAVESVTAEPEIATESAGGASPLRALRALSAGAGGVVGSIGRQFNNLSWKESQQAHEALARRAEERGEKHTAEEVMLQRLSSREPGSIGQAHSRNGVSGRLTVIEGPGSGSSVDLAHFPLTLGGDTGCDVTLPELAQQQARILFRDGRFVIHKLIDGETGGAEANHWAVVENGDQLSLGPYKLQLTAIPSTDHPPAASRSTSDT